MNRSLVSVARRVLTLDTTPTPKWHFYSSPSSSPSNNKLFVGGLSWSVDEKTLTDAFSSYGDVSEVRIMYDKETGRSRGFGFVNFSKEDDARSAKDAMDGKAFLGRPLRISFALEKLANIYFSKEVDARSAKDAMDGTAFLGRPLRISFALEKVRGAPFVVPRLSNIGDATNRNQ